MELFGIYSLEMSDHMYEPSNYHSAVKENGQTLGYVIHARHVLCLYLVFQFITSNNLFYLFIFPPHNEIKLANILFGSFSYLLCIYFFVELEHAISNFQKMKKKKKSTSLFFFFFKTFFLILRVKT